MKYLLVLCYVCLLTISKPAFADVYDFVLGGPPKAPEERGIKTLESPRFVVGYEEDEHNPAWAAYHFGRQNEYFDSPRPKGKTFVIDKRTKNKLSEKAFSPITKTKLYDKGHLAPSHSMGKFFGPDAQNETFIMTNVVPQTKVLNAGLWRGPEDLESENYGIRFDDLWVTAGPIYDDEQYFEGGIRRPSHCFKILAMKDERGQAHAIAFIFPQDLERQISPIAPSKTTPEKIYAWVKKNCIEDENYQVSVAEVERRSHLKFFTELPPSTQTRLRNTVEELWVTADDE